jgi:hypothetical protein
MCTRVFGQAVFTLVYVLELVARMYSKGFVKALMMRKRRLDIIMVAISIISLVRACCCAPSLSRSLGPPAPFCLAAIGRQTQWCASDGAVQGVVIVFHENKYNPIICWPCRASYS